MTPQQYPFAFPHRESMREDDFMAADSNRDALAWIRSVSEWPSHALVLYGPKGGGKTHLIQVWLTRERGAAITPEDLTGKDHVSLTRTTQNLAFDDAEIVAGDRIAEEALFHLYNHLRSVGGRLLLSAKRPPVEWGVTLPDLLSRLRASTATEIQAPDDALLTALFLKQIYDRQLDIGEDVIKFMIARIERTPDAVADAVDRLDKLSLAKHAKITVALAREMLKVDKA